MKNIHILPTDKPSRLHLQNGNLVLHRLQYTLVSQHIYITNDEEIKEGDWFYNTISLKPEPFKACENGDGYVNCSKYSHYRIDCKKIILTTDQDLIQDGVQAIDDEFLEWFVKNPSCEFVEVEHNYIDFVIDNYKILIPNEEPKRHLIDMMRSDEELGLYEEPKQETLEEVAERLCQYVSENPPYTIIKPKYKIEGFIEGAKWQQQQNNNLYSEEEVEDLIQFLSMNEDFNNYSSISIHTAKYFLEQFKKK